MAIEEPILKLIKLENIGFLGKESTYVNCPCCEAFLKSTIHLEPVTYFQRFLHFSNLGKKWSSRNDINHYCSNCGCFIGRYRDVDCGERCISRTARRKAAEGDMTLKMKPKDCAANMQKTREKVKKEQELKKAKKLEQEEKTKGKVEEEKDTKVAKS